MKEKLEEMGVKTNIMKMMRKDKTWYDAYVIRWKKLFQGWE